MTTTEIAKYADPEALASPDINLQAELRYNVIPLFYEDISEVGWRRKHAFYDQALAGDRDFALPLDFSEMRKIVAGATAAEFDHACGLPYIGDIPELVAAAEASSVPAPPSAYYIDWNFASFPLVRLTAPLDQPVTFRYSYISKIKFLDSTSEIELNAFIPEQFQWGLVYGLQRIIYARRFGVSDNRFVFADKEYARVVEMPRKNRERTGVERPRFVN